MNVKKKTVEPFLGAARDLINKLESPQIPMQQQGAIDIRKIEEYNYRRGLIAALECIIRELR
jgi:hypothetical protein